MPYFRTSLYHSQLTVTLITDFLELAEAEAALGKRADARRVHAARLAVVRNLTSSFGEGDIVTYYSKSADRKMRILSNFDLFSWETEAKKQRSGCVEQIFQAQKVILNMVLHGEKEGDAGKLAKRLVKESRKESFPGSTARKLGGKRGLLPPGVFCANYFACARYGVLLQALQFRFDRDPTFVAALAAVPDDKLLVHVRRGFTEPSIGKGKEVDLITILMVCRAKALRSEQI